MQQAAFQGLRATDCPLCWHCHKTPGQEQESRYFFTDPESYSLYCFLILEAPNKDDFWFKVGAGMFIWPHSFLHNVLIRPFRPEFEGDKFSLWTCVTPPEVDVTWLSDSWGQTSLFSKDVMDKKWFPRLEYDALINSHRRSMEKMTLKPTPANTSHHFWVYASTFLACKGTFAQGPQAPTLEITQDPFRCASTAGRMQTGPEDLSSNC